MAKKTGKKVTKTKAKAKSGVRNATPKLTTCPHVAKMIQPHTTESSGKLAGKLTDFFAVVAEWTTNVRKAYTDGTALPDFPISKFVNPNTGIMTRAAFEKIVDSFNEGENVDFPPRYNPVLVDLVHAMNCQSMRKFSLTRFWDEEKEKYIQPKKWDEKEFGNWWHEHKEDGETIQEASGWDFDSAMPRRCHADKAESLIDDPANNILTFSGSRYVVGTGTHDDSACFKVWQTSHGNYRAGDRTRKRMSLAGIPEIRDIVFRIEDKPNNGGGVTVKGKWADVCEMVYMPGQVLTAGNLYASNGKQLSAKDIRGLDSDMKGLKFKPLEAPIVGKAIDWDKLWADIQSSDRAAIKKMKDRGGRSDEYEAGNPQSKSITNMLVNAKRVDPSEAFPFGLRGSQTNMPAYIVAAGDGKIEDGYFLVGVVVGARSNTEYNVGVHAVKEKAAAKAVKAPKKTKSKTKSDAAPPVDVNTADEVETVKA